MKGFCFSFPLISPLVNSQTSPAFASSPSAAVPTENLRMRFFVPCEVSSGHLDLLLLLRLRLMLRLAFLAYRSQREQKLEPDMQPASFGGGIAVAFLSGPGEIWHRHNE